MTSEREKVSFNQMNSETGHRIRYRKVDAETGPRKCRPIRSSKDDETAKGEYARRFPDEEFSRIRCPGAMAPRPSGSPRDEIGMSFTTFVPITSRRTARSASMLRGGSVTSSSR